MGDAETLSMSTTSLEGQNVSFDELKIACETIPFMSGQRLVIVNGLIGRFEGQSKSRRTKKTTAKTKKTPKQEESEKFGDYLAGGIPETTVLVLVEGVVSGENPVFRSLSGKAAVKSFSLPRDTELQEWIRQRVADEGGTISPKAVQLLARTVGNNLWAMANEVNKLVLYASDRKIEEEDVHILVAANNQQSSVFNMADAILEFKAEQAEQILQNLFLNGEAPVYLLYMLSRQLQQIVRIKEMKRLKLTNSEIQGKLNMRSDWVFKKTVDQSNRYTMERLKEVYKSILETDVAIKTGRLEPELALNVLVAELCRKGQAIAAAAETRRR